MKNALGLIFGNIHEREVPELTASRTLGSVPFGGRFRLIDFALSNMANSGITKVGIITKKNYQSLMRHVGSGKPWDMSRKHGGLSVLPPFGTETESGTYRSRLEALDTNYSFFKQTDEDYVIISDCDAVCNIDFDDAMHNHIRNAADVTLIYRKKDLGQNDGKMRTVLFVGAGGRIESAQYTDIQKGENNIYANMLIVGRRFLLNLLDESRRNRSSSFTRELIVEGAKKYAIYGYELKGYYASIDSTANYFKHSLELLDRQKRKMLFDNNGARIYTKIHDSAPCKFGKNAVVANSMIADGCIIDGEVTNSILFRGVKVMPGARIENSILFQNTVVMQNARLSCVIADKNCSVSDSYVLKGTETNPLYLEKGSRK